MNETFPAYVVRKDDEQVTAGVEQVGHADLPEGDVTIEVAYSSLNYKDALAATGHPGVVRRFPHVPGIDAAGTVVESASERFATGDPVVVTGYDLGVPQWGGLAQYIRVPADWIVPLPAGLTLREAMIYGTAGFTAAQSVMAVTRQAIDPRRGPVVVTGASGGVGSLAVGMLAKAGYTVVAVTGKDSARDFLSKLGAAEIVGRDAVDEKSDRPLLSTRWSSAIDTVGGNILATLIRSTDHRGVVTACGLVAGADLPPTVHPFILRGVRLIGIDSAKCPMPERLAVWEKLAGEWKIDDLESLATTIDLAGVTAKVQDILAGRVIGRTVVEPR